jgi:hypothetical protein
LWQKHKKEKGCLYFLLHGAFCDKRKGFSNKHFLLAFCERNYVVNEHVLVEISICVQTRTILATRVTRLGEFPPIGRLFSLGSFF